MERIDHPAAPTPEALRLIGQPVVDVRGRSLGRVVAVIHGASAVDVILEQRRLLRLRRRRIPAGWLVVHAQGVLVCVETLPPLRRHGDPMSAA